MDDSKNLSDKGTLVTCQGVIGQEKNTSLRSAQQVAFYGDQHEIRDN